MESLREQIGGHIMLSLRVIFPDATNLIKNKLETVTLTRQKGSSSLFAALDTRTNNPPAAEGE
jgi:hypothetical protein